MYIYKPKWLFWEKDNNGDYRNANPGVIMDIFGIYILYATQLADEYSFKLDAPRKKKAEVIPTTQKYGAEQEKICCTSAKTDF